MACDGEIVSDEIAAIKAMAREGVFPAEGIDQKIRGLVDQLNAEGKGFMKSYLNSLDQFKLTRNEALKLLKVAVRIIVADNNFAYSEVKFFRAVRMHLPSIEDEYILNSIPEIDDYWLDSDIQSDNVEMDYFDSIEIPKFDIKGI